MPHTRRTKIVCTLGPATSTLDSIRAIAEAGMNVARLNFSHGTHADHAERIEMVRSIARELGRPIAILGDLQGPRIRIGNLDHTIQLRPGDDIVLVHEGEEAPGDIPVTYDALASDVNAGDRILVNDGLIELVTLDVVGPRVHARVIHGGDLNSHKGLNLPGVQVSAPSLTEKDIADAEFAVAQDLDYLALSFVRRPEDIESLRKLLPPTMYIIAKIEKDAALANIDAIVRASDGVMVARGDLGVELPFEEVPVAQKKIIALANRIGRPVITATQMLESMVSNPRPTRAEASDVANAILDGTDAAMLSAETAAGAYPRLAVEAMSRIITEVEQHPPSRQFHDPHEPPVGIVTTEVAIAAATVAAVKMLGSPLVVVITKSGFSARIVSSHRPPVPILALTDNARTCNQMALLWGVIPYIAESPPSYTEMAEVGKRVVRELQLASPGDRVVFTAGHPFGYRGTTNLMKVEVI
ncbi:MAG: pyruvate kinase [Gemmatimonadaceae bacterium]